MRSARWGRAVAGETTIWRTRERLAAEGWGHAGAYSRLQTRLFGTARCGTVRVSHASAPAVARVASSVACPTKEGIVPAKSPPNAKSSAVALADPGVASQDPEMGAAGREISEDLGASGADEFPSPAGRRAAERTARRRQRAEAREASSDQGHRLPQSRVRTPAGASMLRDSLPAPLIVVIAGGVLGVILGALGVGGWVIGLLVAGLTVVLLPALRSKSDSTRASAR